MKFSEIAEFLKKRGYVEYEIKDHHMVFYEYNKLDFLYIDCAKRYEFDYYDGNVDKVVMTQYWYNTTYFKDIFSMEELEQSI